MRLSEAIKLGAMLKPQGFGDYQTGDGGACALGSALDAVGVAADKQNGLTDLSLALRFPAVNTPATCPWKLCRDTFAHEIGSVITHLNDDHCWTRERIADWVATVEPQETTSDGISHTTNAVARTDDQLQAVTSR